MEKKTFKELYMTYNKHHNKPGYFVVGWELINCLYNVLESHGYHIPDVDKKNHRMRPDISVQDYFHEFMKRRYHELSDIFTYGAVIDPADKIPMTVRHYKNRYLSDFREFLETEWFSNQGVQYFKRKDKNVLPFLNLLKQETIIET
jgi:hypothetical protein